MKINYLLFVSIVLMLVSCGTPKQATVKKEKVNQPEGIQFTTVKNYKSFASINYPYSGSGFSKNQDVDIDRNRNDADEFVPGVIFKGEHVSIWSKIKNTEGDLDVQFTALKKKRLYPYIKENSKVNFEKKQIGGKDVALIRIVTPYSRGGFNYSFGYLVAQDENTASLFLLYDVNKNEEADMKADEAILDKVFIYMIKTVEFR